MRPETEKAKQLLAKDNRTLVLCNKNETITSGGRGVKTLLSLAESGRNLADFCAADKAVGKGAAALFVLLGVKEIYAEIMSEKAKQLLSDNSIDVYAALTVPAILNRKKDGFCPIETAVDDIDDPKEALPAIKGALKKMAAFR